MRGPERSFEASRQLLQRSDPKMAEAIDVVEGADFLAPPSVPLHDAAVKFNDADLILRKNLFHDVFAHHQRRRIFVERFVVGGLQDNHHTVADKAKIASDHLVADQELVDHRFATLTEMFKNVAVEAALRVVETNSGAVLSFPSGGLEPSVLT